ncbi:hypothetical protein TNCV_1989881 [Trichonephila clavipes]|nr:hypothetical protein TNCV_1989881 [Trichonephila clavipes]
MILDTSHVFFLPQIVSKNRHQDSSTDLPKNTHNSHRSNCSPQLSNLPFLARNRTGQDRWWRRKNPINKSLSLLWPSSLGAIIGPVNMDNYLVFDISSELR